MIFDIFYLQIILDVVAFSLLLQNASQELHLCKLLIPRGMVIYIPYCKLNSQCITIINTASGEVINRLGQNSSGKVELNFPNGVALTQDHSCS